MMRGPTRREWSEWHRLARVASVAQRRAEVSQAQASVAMAEANLYLETLREDCRAPIGAALTELKGHVRWVHPKSTTPVADPNRVAETSPAPAEPSEQPPADGDDADAAESPVEQQPLPAEPS